jgi:hypothetical protein
MYRSLEGRDQCVFIHKTFTREFNSFHNNLQRISVSAIEGHVVVICRQLLSNLRKRMEFHYYKPNRSSACLCLSTCERNLPNRLGC